MACVLVALAGCVSRLSQFKSQGLEDLVSCRFDTEAAEVMDSSHISDVRSKSLKKVTPEFAAQFADHAAKDFSRPRDELSIFGAKVHGIFFFSMHGAGFFSALVEGNMEKVKAEMETQYGLKFSVYNNPQEPTYASSKMLLKNGISMRDFVIEQEIETRAYIQVAKKTPSLLMISCAFELVPAIPKNAR